jgi:hypothetical protein
MFSSLSTKRLFTFLRKSARIATVLHNGNQSGQKLWSLQTAAKHSEEGGETFAVRIEIRTSAHLCECFGVGVETCATQKWLKYPRFTSKTQVGGGDPAGRLDEASA